MATNTMTSGHSASHHHSETKTSTSSHAAHDETPYLKFFVTMGIHAVVMYAVMYTMIDSMRDYFNNLNQVYMVGMMLAPMAILMLVSMKEMYRDKKKNLLVYTGAAIAFIGSFIFMREQTLIGDKQFLRSMIPHHSGAVLMCNEAQIVDPEIKSLCATIIAGQEAEIEQMKSILNRIQ